MHFYEYPTGKTKRVWLEKEEVVNLEITPLPPAAHLARTVYFIQHYAHGSRVGVILRLKWKDRANGRLKFVMDKGGFEKDVEESPELTALLDSLLPASGRPRPDAYILPYLPANFEQLHPQLQVKLMKNKLTTINDHLRRIAKNLGIDKRMSSHVARRTLATLSERALGGDLRATGGLLGHRRTSTTEIYLRGMDTTQLDTASRTVYEALRAGKTQVKQNSDARTAPAPDDTPESAPPLSQGV